MRTGYLRLWAASVAVVCHAGLVSGCGGSGGASPSANPSPAPAPAPAPSPAPAPAPAPAPSPPPAPSAIQADNYVEVAKVFGRLMEVTQTQPALAEPPRGSNGVPAPGTSTTTTFCAVSGSYTQTYLNPALPQAEFSMTTVFNGCQFTRDVADLVAVVVTRTGQITERWSRTTRNGTGDLTGYDIAQTVAAYTNSYALSNGETQRRACSGAKRVQAEGLTSASATYTDTYSDFTCEITQVPTLVNRLTVQRVVEPQAVSFRYAGSFAGTTRFDVVQESPFVQGATFTPTQGQLRITDSAGAAVVIRARSDQLADVEYFPLGSSVAVKSSVIGWTILLGQ